MERQKGQTPPLVLRHSEITVRHVILRASYALSIVEWIREPKNPLGRSLPNIGAPHLESTCSPTKSPARVAGLSDFLIYLFTNHYSLITNYLYPAINANPKVPGPVCVPTAGLTSVSVVSAGFSRCVASASNALASSAALAGSADRCSGVRPPTRSVNSSTRRSSALRLVRTRSVASRAPSTTSRIGFKLSAVPTKRAAPPMRPPRCRNSSVSTTNNTPALSRASSMILAPSAADLPALAALAPSSSGQPGPLEG